METRFLRVRPLLATLLLAACSAAPGSTPAATTQLATPGTATQSLSPATAVPATTPSATTSPTATALPSDGVWRQVQSDPAIAAVEFTDITWNRVRFVAIGHGDPSGRTDLGGTFLESVDGLHWSAQVPAGGAWSATSIAAGPGGLVAIGSIGDRFASFTSPDGTVWTPHPDALPIPDLGTDELELTDIVSTGEGWIVVGRRDEACQIDCGLSPTRAYVWTSPDGVNWTRVADQASLKGAGMNAISQAGAGYVAAGDANGHAAIWTSLDARVWSRVPDGPMFGSDAEPPVTAEGVAEGLGTYVVVGSSLAQDTCDPALKDAVCPGIRAWWTDDGHTWTRAAGAGFRDGQARGVVTATAGFLLLGLAGGCPGGIGRSMDGRMWACDTTDPAMDAFLPSAGFASDDTELIVGTTFFGDDESALRPAGTIWYRVGA